MGKLKISPRFKLRALLIYGSEEDEECRTRPVRPPTAAPPNMPRAQFWPLVVFRLPDLAEEHAIQPDHPDDDDPGHCTGHVAQIDRVR